MYRQTAFKFNVEGAFIGVLEPTAVKDAGLTHTHFIATPLLPCGQADKPIEKFTGNANCGLPPGLRDHATATLHAFTHFVYQYTNGEFILCDLQGTPASLHS